MEIDQETPVSSSVTEPSAEVSDAQYVVPTIDHPHQPVQPIVPPSVHPPLMPTIAPIPTGPRAMAPIPALKPSSTQNGEAGPSDSDSDKDDSKTSLAVEYEISEESKIVRERREKIIQDILMKQRAAALAVPTNDMAVRDRLRRLGEPITLFGEREMERRERLRMIMAKLDSEGQLEKLMSAQKEEETVSDGDEETLQYPFYTEGPQALMECRAEILKFSVKKAALRLRRARRRMDDPDEDVDAEIDLALKRAESLVLDCSELGDDRPLSGCSFSHDGKMLAASSINGVAKLWNMPQVHKVSTLEGHEKRRAPLHKVSSLKGHTERVTDVAFSPVDSHIATASADRTARLWNTEGVLLKTFKGHLDRLARIAFHPTGKYLGTTSFDKTWRLWDVNTGAELILQEGHSRSVYGIDFHHDGSLAASCGLDSLARVWDLRTGRSILALEGHVKPVLGVSFSPNGYHLATGGEDNTCRIWDLRMKRSLYIIPAHSKLVSQVKYESQEGYFLVTSSHDMTAKVWSGRDFRLVKTLSGHEEKVTSLDITGDGSYIVTVTHDRKIKLWSSKKDDEDSEKEDENTMDVD